MTQATVTSETATMDPSPMSAFPKDQGSLALLGHPVAQELLQSTVPARLAYVARDGTPRVVPLLFHWTGEELVIASWPDDPKVDALREHPDVAVTIDTSQPPFQVLSIRGVATVDIVDGLAAECEPMFCRYMGPEQGRGWAEMMAGMTDRMARIAIRPSWVGVLDFTTRIPSGMARRQRLAAQ